MHPHYRNLDLDRRDIWKAVGSDYRKQCEGEEGEDKEGEGMGKGRQTRCNGEEVSERLQHTDMQAARNAVRCAQKLGRKARPRATTAKFDSKARHAVESRSFAAI